MDDKHQHHGGAEDPDESAVREDRHESLFMQPVRVVVVDLRTQEHLEVAVGVEQQEENENEARDGHQLLNKDAGGPRAALLRCDILSGHAMSISTLFVRLVGPWHEDPHTPCRHAVIFRYFPRLSRARCPAIARKTPRTIGPINRGRKARILIHRLHLFSGGRRIRSGQGRPHLDGLFDGVAEVAGTAPNFDESARLVQADCPLV